MDCVKRQLRIDGMTCVNCQNKIEQKLKATEGIREAKVSYNKGTANIVYDPELISLKDIIAIIEKLDYKVITQKQESRPDIGRSVSFLIVIICLYILLQQFGILNMLVPSRLADTGMGYGMLFVIGLVTSVHCIAMCGGINLSQCIPQGTDVRNGGLSTFRPALLYNLGRVISYTAIGFILGLVGMLLGGASGSGLPVFFQGIIKLIAGIFMVIMGINMLGIFPQLRKFSLRPPKALATKISTQKGKSKRPLVVGLLNGLMPCGPLQAMQLVALAAGNPLAGALSMFLFSLGTVPLMLGLGSLVSMLGRKFVRQTMNVGAVLVTVLGLAMLSQGASLSGIPLIGQQKAEVEAAEAAEVVDGVQVVRSTLVPGSYPNITVQAGTPVKWIIDAPAGSINGCNYKMLLNDFGIEHAFQEGENVIEFTPTKAGTYRYSCWMGMIHGNIFVTSADGTANAEDGAAADVPVPAGYQIPSAELAIAELKTDSSGNTVQEVSIELTGEGFSPAVIVVQSGVTVTWNIEVNQSGADTGVTLLAPIYSTALALADGSNGLYLYPTESFEVYTGDNAFYAYVKVVDDLGKIDEEAIREEVDAFETLIYPYSIFESTGGGSCCG